MMRAFLVFLLFILSSCASVHSIRYDRLKILKKYTPKYSVQIDSLNVNLNNYFLDPKNIESVNVFRNKRFVQIARKRKLDYLNMNSQIKSTADSLNLPKTQKYKLIIVDGFPYDIDSLDQLKIESSAIESVQILKIPKSHTLDGPFDNTLLIKIKD